MEPNHNREATDLPFNAQVVRDVVDDPFAKGEKISVTRSIRNDPLMGMLSRGFIDKAQFEAGRRWQACYETAGVGQVIAMDPMKEPVDGRGAASPGFSDTQLAAFGYLRDAYRELGALGYAVLHDVLGSGLEIREVARKRGYTTGRGIKYVGLRFRECLETLAQLWSYAARTHSTSQQRHLTAASEAPHE